MYNYSDDSVILGILAALGLGILLIFLIYYILSALVFYNTAKTNGPSDLAFLGWIPIANTYLLFAFGSKKESMEEVKKDALIWIIIYVVLLLLMSVPLIGWLASLASIIIYYYFMYRVLYRWAGETGLAIILLILSIPTGGLVFYIYGLMKMKQPFVEA
ncbi:MAG: hypothetical protein GX072_02835 [Lysinibacillus sp.]|nr:hypothetical protein [Lysinibacillus sp.]